MSTEVQATISPDQFVNRGGTVRPVYGERRPIMYHLFETEMMSISAFNGEALRWFAIGSFCLNCIIAIVIGWGYSGAPLSEFGTFMVHKAVWFFVVTTIASFAFGTWAVCQKRSMINQIKAETRTESL